MVVFLLREKMGKKKHTLVFAWHTLRPSLTIGFWLMSMPLQHPGKNTTDSSLVPSVETLCLLLVCLCLRSGLRGSYERFPPVAGVNGTRCRRRCLFSKIASEREVFRWRGCVCRDGWVNVDESGCRVGWITGYIPVLSLFHFYSLSSLAPG